MTLQKLSIKFNANTAQFDLRVKGKKTELRDPDAGPITALLAIGDQEFRNTQDWRLAEKGKKGESSCRPRGQPDRQPRGFPRRD
ncbi:MAG: hypothetical protein DMD82_03220 [Candidatus Rokuibacteriota bacterium]|nr:MAG: hypothetical protein DMD82_03220 [Candidatus Rokubacteria bacterium]